MMLPSRKIYFHGSIQKEKMVLCYRCKTRHMLGESCPEATSTPENPGMSSIEQSGTLRENLSPVKSMSLLSRLALWEISAENLSSCGGGWQGEFFDGRD